MKTTTIITITLTVIFVLVLGAFGVYAFVGYVDWLFSDPYDWVRDKEVQLNEWSDCIENGGAPIRSIWDSRVIECRMK